MWEDLLATMNVTMVYISEEIRRSEGPKKETYTQDNPSVEMCRVCRLLFNH